MKIASYNCNGFKNNLCYTSNLFSNVDLLLIQEHWLFTESLYNLTKLENVCNYHAVCGMEDGKEVIQGRPYGGLAIVWKHNFDDVIEIIPSKSKRICAVAIGNEEIKYLIINVYMPCDTRVQNVANVPDFVEVLQEIDTITENSKANHVILCGDFNTDFSRNNAHSRLLRDYVSNSSMIDCFDITNNSEVYCTYRDSMGHTSVIDHIFVSEGCSYEVNSVNVIDEGDNLSPHLPVLIDMNMAFLPGSRYINNESIDNNSDHSNSYKMYQWDKASKEDKNLYGEILNVIIGEFADYNCIDCSDLNCMRHDTDIEQLSMTIVNSCIASSDVTIRKRGDKQFKRIPGWNDHVKIYREKALFWHDLWKECGRPSVGSLAEVRKFTRKKYHEAIKTCIREQDVKQNEKLAEALCTGQNRDYWTEIRKIKACKGKTVTSVDGNTSPVDIANNFEERFERLYNSVICTPESDSALTDDINASMTNDVTQSINDSKIYPAEVSKAIRSLKYNKGDGQCELVSDHIINGADALCTPLASLFTLCISHNYVPVHWRTTTIIPIPKNQKKNLSSPENYRAVSLFSTIAKLFEIIMSERLSTYLHTSELQHGFKEGRSTSTCTFALTEVAAHYLNKGSEVYAAFIDATKAFDRVNLNKLFSKLLDRGVPGIFVRFLLQSYRCQIGLVKWAGCNSKAFTYSNGVKQGGILSPKLFSIYIDGMLDELKLSGIGCFIDGNYAGALAYADDLVLLSPSQKGAQSLLDICTNYCSNHDIVINPKKSFYSVFSKRLDEKKDLYLNVIEDGVVNKVKMSFTREPCHLGHILSSDLSTTKDIEREFLNFNLRANSILSTFKSCSPFRRLDLLHTYASSFYGCQLWDLNKLSSIAVSYRRAVRKALCVPARTHNNLLPVITGKPCLEIQIAQRFLTFKSKCIQTGDDLLCSLVDDSRPFNMFSTFHKNIALISERYEVCDNRVRQNSTFNDVIRGEVIRELLSLEGWEAFIAHLCID